MALTVEELEIAAARVDIYPPGYGSSYFAGIHVYHADSKQFHEAWELGLLG